MLVSFPSQGFDCSAFNQGIKENIWQDSKGLEHCRTPPLQLIAIYFLCFFFRRSVGLGKVQAHQPKTECWLPFGPHRIFLEKNPGMVNGKRTVSEQGPPLKSNPQARLILKSHFRPLNLEKMYFFFFWTVSINCKTSEIN